VADGRRRMAEPAIRSNHIYSTLAVSFVGLLSTTVHIYLNSNIYSVHSARVQSIQSYTSLCTFSYHGAAAPKELRIPPDPELTGLVKLMSGFTQGWVLQKETTRAVH
jgi:hypothetical protein